MWPVLVVRLVDLGDRDAGPRTHDSLSGTSQEATAVGDPQHGAEDCQEERNNEAVDHSLLGVLPVAYPRDATENSRHVLHVDLVTKDHDPYERRADRHTSPDSQPRDGRVQLLVRCRGGDHGASEGRGDRRQESDLPPRHVAREPVHGAGDSDLNAQGGQDQTDR